MAKKNIFASMDAEYEARKAAEAEAKRAMRSFKADVDREVGALVRTIFPELYGEVEVDGRKVIVPAAEREQYLRDARELKLRAFVDDGTTPAVDTDDIFDTSIGDEDEPASATYPRVVEG